MVTTLTRAYNNKDVDMLTASEILVELAVAQKTYLISKRSTWADPFLPNLQAQIKKAFKNFLGIDNSKQLRQATQTLLSIQANAIRDLAEFKVQIIEDFKNNKTQKDEILNTLGFTQHHKNAQNKDQDALIQLLYQYQKNMTTTLQTQITNAGMSTNTITTIINYAETLKNSNITQETMKSLRKVISQEGIIEFNQIYSQVISIARISYKFFKHDKALQSQFSYAKTVKTLSNSSHNDKTKPPTQ